MREGSSKNQSFQRPYPCAVYPMIFRTICLFPVMGLQIRKGGVEIEVTSNHDEGMEQSGSS